jgi:hypothetical protein
VRRTTTGVLAVSGGAFIALVVGILVLVGGEADLAQSPCSPGGGDAVAVADNVPGMPIGPWSAEQVHNAAAIVATGAQVPGVTERDQRIAVMTAIGESTLIVVDHGDTPQSSSLGLFQQIKTWGPESVRLDPVASARMFYEHLVKVKGRDTMEPTLVAHTVQANADPYHYAKFWNQASDLVTALTTGAGKAVTAAVGAAEPAVDTSTAVACEDLPNGVFAASAATDHVGTYTAAQLMSRAEAFVEAGGRDPFFGSISDGSWYHDCQHFAANLSGRAMSGYPTASDAWASFTRSGTAHPADAVDGHAPPPGAWLYYSSGSPAGHVAVYLGSGKVASTDVLRSGRVSIVPAAAMTDGPWHLTYLGWAAPWGAKVATVAPSITSDSDVGVAAGFAGQSNGSGQFVIGTLNWRGSSHFHRDPHPGETSYRVRVPNMVRVVNASGASIVGFQEFEGPQAQAFLAQAGGAWGIVSGRSSRGRPDTRDAIAFRRADWTPTMVRYVPIRYSRNVVQLPLVRFASRTSSAVAWVLNTHNPANVVGGNNARRDAAVRTQATVLRQVAAADPGAGVFLTGDMNDRVRFARLFLTLAGAGFKAANTSGNQIDWIMTGPSVSVQAFRSFQGTKDRAHRFTDHPFVLARVRIGG